MKQAAHRILSSKLGRTLGLALATALVGASAQAGTNVGVSVNVSQPGFYGRVDVGDQPPPAVIYPQPVIIQQTPVAIHQRPIYLRVPPAHSGDWAHNCYRYRACGQPVYFVRDVPMPPRHDDRRHWDRHDHDHDHGYDHGRRD
ncbi:MAG: hypothetical protein QM749_13725 [Aquabacterium sp.]